MAQAKNAAEAADAILADLRPASYLCWRDWPNSKYCQKGQETANDALAEKNKTRNKRVKNSMKAYNTVSIMIFVLRNMLRKNEFMEDFITKQSEAIVTISKRLDELDEKGMFKSDDQIGWFFKAVKDIQASLNEFTLK